MPRREGRPEDQRPVGAEDDRQFTVGADSGPVGATEPVPLGPGGRGGDTDEDDGEEAVEPHGRNELYGPCRSHGRAKPSCLPSQSVPR